MPRFLNPSQISSALDELDFSESSGSEIDELDNTNFRREVLDSDMGSDEENEGSEGQERQVEGGEQIDSGSQADTAVVQPDVEMQNEDQVPFVNPNLVDDPIGEGGSGANIIPGFATNIPSIFDPFPTLTGDDRITGGRGRGRPRGRPRGRATSARGRGRAGTSTARSGESASSPPASQPQRRSARRGQSSETWHGGGTDSSDNELPEEEDRGYVPPSRRGRRPRDSQAPPDDSEDGGDGGDHDGATGDRPPAEQRQRYVRDRDIHDLGTIERNVRNISLIYFILQRVLTTRTITIHTLSQKLRRQSLLQLRKQQEVTHQFCVSGQTRNQFSRLLGGVVRQ